MTELLPVLLLGLVAVAFVGGPIGVFDIVGSYWLNPTKLGAYESGKIRTRTYRTHLSA